MAKKVLSAILTLKDQNFSTNMRKAGKGVNSFDKRVKYSGNQVKKFAKNTKSSFSSIAKAAVGLGAAYMGINKLNSFKNESIELAKAQIEAETKLAAVMKNTKGVTDEQIQSIKDYASAQQNLGVIGDEVQLAGVQQLATYQLQSDTLKKLMPGMNDLVAQQKGLNATQGDAVNIGNMVGKVMAGQVGALSRAGINFTKAQEKILKYGTESEKAATLAQVLEQNVGGVNKALSETDDGKIQQMKNSWGDYKEEIGKKILPMQAQFAGWFVKHIPTIQRFVLGGIDKVSSGINKFKRIGTSAFERVKKVIKDNQPTIDNVRNGIIFLGEKAIAVKDWFVSAFTIIKQKIDENRPSIDGVRSVLSDMGDKALALKDWMSSAFEKAKPGINWLKDEGLPLVVDGIAGVIDKATEIYNYLTNNWSTFEPLVYGIAGAILFYKGAVAAVSLATKGWAVVTGILTVAQTGFNAVLAISPLGWVAIAIGAVIAAGVLLYKNWDTVKAKASELWEGLTGAWNGIGEGFSNMWTGIKNSAKSGVNFVIDGLNKMINGFNNFASFKVPDWVPGIGGMGWEMSVPTIPKFAQGTNYFKGGLAQINERGGEIVDLPNGSRVYPHDKSVNMARQEGRASNNNVDLSELIKLLTKLLKEGRKNDVKIIINAQDKTVSQILSELIPQLKLVLANM